MILRDLRDGTIGALPPAALDLVVEEAVNDAATLVVFEPGGVTGHPDHRTTTKAAQRVASDHGLAVLEWGVDPEVATQLNAELGTTFVALEGEGVDELVVDRSTQHAAIACHESQVGGYRVVVRRLGLEGDVQRVRLRRPPGADQAP